MITKAKKLTEEQVLEKLNIPNFRYVSKDKLMTFFSMIPEMDPEVAKKAIEQFPEYAGAVKEVVKEFSNLADRSLKDNQDSMNSYYEICRKMIDVISKELDRDNLSFDERTGLINQMRLLEEQINKKDTENKKYRLKVLTMSAALIGAGICSLAAVLGTNSNFKIPEIKGHNINPLKKRGI